MMAGVTCIVNDEGVVSAKQVLGAIKQLRLAVPDALIQRLNAMAAKAG